MAGRLQVGPDSLFSWIIAFASMLVVAATFGIYRASGVLYVEVIRVFEVDRETASWPFAICGVFLGISSPIAGALLSFYSGRQIVLAGTFLSALGLGLCCIPLGHIWISVFYGGIFGTGIGWILTSFPIILNEYFVKNRTTANGICLAGSPLSVFLLAPLSEYFIDTYTLRGAFLLLSGVAVQSLVLVALFRPLNVHKAKAPTRYMKVYQEDKETVTADPVQEMEVYNVPIENQPSTTDQVCRTGEEARRMDVYNICLDKGSKPASAQSRILNKYSKLCKQMGKVMASPMFHIITFNSMTTTFTLLTVTIILVDAAEDKHIERDRAVIILSVTSIPDIVGRMCSGWVTDRGILQRKTALMLTQVVSGATLFIVGFVENEIALFVLLMVYGFIMASGYVLINVLYTEFMPPEILGLSLGLRNIGTTFALFARPWIIGMFRDKFGSYDYLFMSIAGVVIFSGLLMLLEPRLTKRSQRVYPVDMPP